MASSSVEFNKNFDGNSRNLKWTESIATIASLVLPGGPLAATARGNALTLS